MGGMLVILLDSVALPPRPQLWQLHTEKRALRKAYLDHWNATRNKTNTGRPVDAIISPAVAYTACPHGLN